MRAALLSLVFVAAVGCKVKNPNYCEETDSHLCTDGGIPPEKCSATDPCDVGVCKEPPGVCVECTATQDDACTGAKPFCDEAANNTCRACKLHSECSDSNVCMPDGTCAVKEQVLYVKPNGPGTTCTKDQPCPDVMAALAAPGGRTIMRIEGFINAAPIMVNNRNMTMLGDTTTELRRTGGGDILTVDGTSVLKLYGIKLANAVGNVGVNAGGGHTGTLELQRCTVTNNSTGIAYGGTGTFILSRSIISENINNGGVTVTGLAKFDITNNFIVRNGNTTQPGIGGFSANIGTTTSRLEFNTIVDNKNIASGSRAGGMYCDINGVTAANNLVARNTIPAGTGNPQVGGNCVTSGSLVQDTLAGLLFVESEATSMYDYHLKVGSGGIDTATGTLMTDFDGEARPNGTARDMGADELH